NLSGCVHDAEDFMALLTDSLRVPPCRIKCLRNGEATRAGILDALESHFVNNDSIKKGRDAMVCFYAGHGGRIPTPQGWSSEEGKIETICPHDEATHLRSADGEDYVVPGIPDRTFDGLMRRLAYKKGDNVTVIFDSCHSGGMSR
ncbi:uncharacterized protein B0H18DRAFT_842930, partial [Fomitopsis serialis]|uniref:uncharacterized protein n=1 Tax=Fomitopsis serialis TaxID=139415 RepID=UPI0020089B6D